MISVFRFGWYLIKFLLFLLSETFFLPLLAPKKPLMIHSCSDDDKDLLSFVFVFPCFAHTYQTDNTLHFTFIIPSGWILTAIVAKWWKWLISVSFFLKKKTITSFNNFITWVCPNVYWIYFEVFLMDQRSLVTKMFSYISLLLSLTQFEKWKISCCCFLRIIVVCLCKGTTEKQFRRKLYLNFSLTTQTSKLTCEFGVCWCLQPIAHCIFNKL